MKEKDKKSKKAGCRWYCPSLCAVADCVAIELEALHCKSVVVVRVFLCASATEDKINGGLSF